MARGATNSLLALAVVIIAQACTGLPSGNANGGAAARKLQGPPPPSPPPAEYIRYRVSVRRLVSEDLPGPVVSGDPAYNTSLFARNGFASWLSPGGGDEQALGLMLAVSNGSTSSGRAALTRVLNASAESFERVEEGSVVYGGEASAVTKPFVTHRADDGLYYMFYAETTAAAPGTHRLALATAVNPADPANWTRRCTMFPQYEITWGQMCCATLLDQGPGASPRQSTPWVLATQCRAPPPGDVLHPRARARVAWRALRTHPVLNHATAVSPAVLSQAWASTWCSTT